MLVNNEILFFLVKNFIKDYLEPYESLWEGELHIDNVKVEESTPSFLRIAVIYTVTNLSDRIEHVSYHTLNVTSAQISLDYLINDITKRIDNHLKEDREKFKYKNLHEECLDAFGKSFGEEV